MVPLAAPDSSRIRSCALFTPLSALLHEGQTCTQDKPKVGYFVPTRYDGDEGRQLLVRHAREVAHQEVRASILHHPHYTVNKVLLGADQDAYNRHPSFREADVDTFQERNPSAAWACHFGISTTVSTGLVTIPISSRQTKKTALRVAMLAVITIRQDRIV